MTRLLMHISRLLIAPVFIFSGFVKAIDPLGSTYKFSDYFHAFGLDFMAPLSFALAIILSTTELYIGLALLMGIFMRFSSWLLLIFMSFFTVLTLIVALTNPVTDCGCFGDALILTNWQTFWKNIVFMLPTLLVFFWRKNFQPFGNSFIETSVGVSLIIVGIMLSVISYRNLPFIDFRPYKTGVNIPAAMSYPENAERDSVQLIYIYEKEGVKKEFTLENLPFSDTAWKYVDRIDKLIKKGYVPPIHDFTITGSDGFDITDSVLTNEYSLLLIAYDLSKTSEDGIKNVKEFAETLKNYQVPTYGMTASSFEEMANFKQKHGLDFDFFASDEIMLKTVIRANPGVVLLNRGTIIGEWHSRNLPAIDKNKGGVLPSVLQNNLATQVNWVIMFFIVLLAFIVLASYHFSKKGQKKLT